MVGKVIGGVIVLAVVIALLTNAMPLQAGIALVVGVGILLLLNRIKG